MKYSIITPVYNRADCVARCLDSVIRNLQWGVELEHIVVCHAVHDICTHKPYSIPDLLRLNDFWVEAHLVCQHIIDQNGKRYNSD